MVSIDDLYIGTFRHLFHNISETMSGTTCLLLATNRKSHTGFRLVPISMTLDDLE